MRSCTVLDPHHNHFTRLQKHLGVMDPASKLLLDEMKKLGDRFSLVESHVDSLEGSLGDRFKLVEQSANNLVAWQPGIDSAISDLTTKLSAVDDIQSQLGSLTTKLD